MKNSKFIFISYSLPAEPSRIRVYVWRWLKKEGALNMQQSLWLLPDTDRNRKIAEDIKGSIEKDGGSVYIVSGQFIHGEENIICKFSDDRDSEYKELLEYCEKFHKEMKDETGRKNFTFAELEENDEEINKLCGWYDKIKLRDYFNSHSGQIAEKEIELCRKELDEFTARVYQQGNLKDGGIE